MTHSMASAVTIRPHVRSNSGDRIGSRTAGMLKVTRVSASDAAMVSVPPWDLATRGRDNSRLPGITNPVALKVNRVEFSWG